MKHRAESGGTSRRRFLRGAAAAGAAMAAAPSIVRAQGPVSMRWQSTWPSKDIFHEFALDFAKKVNDMTGGDLKIEVLPAVPSCRHSDCSMRFPKERSMAATA